MNYKSIICAAILAIGMVAMAFVIKAGMDNRTFNGRTISVRGVATKQVIADKASASFSFETSAATPQEAKQIHNAWTDSIAKLASKYKIPADCMNRSAIRIYTRNTYDDHGNITSTYYVADGTISFCGDSTLVENFYNLDKNRDQLIDMGVIWEYSTFNYSFSDNSLTSIKPEMLTTATKNARIAAEQLAENNHCKVGDIVSASQGYFEVNDIAGRPSYEKMVRVVNNAEFYLK